MKKLLHLYNYGHNPFPTLGKGGLGYHLPQYHKRMIGGTLKIDDEGNPIEYDELDENFLIIDDKNEPVGQYFSLPDNKIKIQIFNEPDNISQGDPPIASEKIIDRPKKNKSYVRDPEDPYSYDFFVGTQPDELPPEIQALKTPPKMKEYATTKNSLNDIIDDLISENPYLFPTKIYAKSYHKTLKDKEDIVDKMYDMLYPTKKELSFNEKYADIIHKHKIAKEEQDVLDLQQSNDDEEEPAITEEERIEKIISDIPTLPIDEQIEVVKEEYSVLVNYYKERQTSSGKGYESFLAGPGACILKLETPNRGTDVNDLKVIPYDKSSLLKTGDERKYCVVDFFLGYPTKLNIPYGIICESKDYQTDNMLEYNDPKSNYIAIQVTKLCGTSFEDKKESGFDIYFKKYTTNNNYYIYGVFNKGKNITHEKYVTDYLLTINAGDTSWICNLLKTQEFCDEYINDKTMKRVVGYNNVYRIDITSKSFPKHYDYVSGSSNKVMSIRIPKRLFKNVIKT